MKKILLNAGPSRAGWHRLETFLVCPALFAYKYRQGGAGIDAATGRVHEPLVRGSIVHVGLAHLYARMRAAQRRQDPDVYYTPAEAMRRVAPTFGPMGAAMLPIAEMTFAGYVDRYAEDSMLWEIDKVEDVVEVDVRDGARGPHDFTQRWDLTAKDKGSGLYYIIDHKIVTAWKPQTLLRYNLSGQFLAAQFIGRMVYGAKFGGVIINFLQAAPMERYKREPLDPAPDALRAIPRTICDAEEGIARLDASDRDLADWPRTFSEKVCMTAYGPCDAYDICRWGR